LNAIAGSVYRAGKCARRDIFHALVRAHCASRSRGRAAVSRGARRSEVVHVPIQQFRQKGRSRAAIQLKNREIAGEQAEKAPNFG